MTLSAKLHERRFLENGREVVRTITALCDADLLGKVLEEGDLAIDLQKYRSFYEGETVPTEEAARMLREGKNLNIVGKQSVALALKTLNIPKRQVRKIAGVPHLQVYYV